MNAATTPTRLWLVRHAQPLIAPGVCYGQLDVAADDSASRDAALRLAQALPPRCTVWTSTLQRCELLQQYLQFQRPDFTYQSETALKELDFGRWEGQRWDDLPRAEIDAWAADLAHGRPHGGENLGQMLHRVNAALQQAMHHTPPENALVWLTHAGVIRCVQWLRAHGLQLPDSAAQWQLPAPAFGQCLEIELASR